MSTADERPAALNAVDECSDVGVDWGRGLRAVVGDVKGQREISSVLDIEGGEARSGMDCGVVGDFKMWEVASPARVGCGDPVGKKKRVENLIEPLSESNSLMMGGGGSLEADTQGGVGSSNNVRDEDGSSVGADAAGEALIAGDEVEVEIEDLLRGWGSLNRRGDDTTGELVGEDEDVVIPIINEADTVKIHSDDIPGVVTVARQVEGAGGLRGTLERAQTSQRRIYSATSGFKEGQ